MLFLQDFDTPDEFAHDLQDVIEVALEILHAPFEFFLFESGH
jgi:hypothetical protein